MLGSRRIGGDERKIDLRLVQLRKLNLGFLGGFLEPLNGHAILAEVDALIFLKLADDPLDDALINVVATQVRVARGGLDLDYAFAHFQNGNIKGAAAQIVDGDGFVLLLIQTIG